MKAELSGAHSKVASLEAKLEVAKARAELEVGAAQQRAHDFLRPVYFGIIDTLQWQR